MNKDYYNILGIQKNASKEELKKAYHKMARKYHPDKDNGDEKKFKEINEAYYVLGDEKRRSEYDRYGRVFSNAGGNQSGFGNFEGFSAGGGSAFGGDFSDFSDIFENLFGFSGARGDTKKQRGRDISIDMEVSFEEAIFGTTRKVLLTKPGVCDDCKGKGSAPDAIFKKCDHCQGSGKIHETRRSFFGTFTVMKSCVSCEGTGKIPSKKCRECKGSGIVKKAEEIIIEIPSGIYNGEMIKQTGRGEAVAKGISGDLYIKVHVKPHSVFKREGFNITMDLSIPLSEALLGGERKIKTLEGEIKMKIPAGINYGEILRTRNKGVPQPNGERGDLLIKILVKIPKNLSPKSRKLIEELKKEGI
ncbi:molecular chaperone DnaJ [Patescibacteria group bacterium]|nr:molecular chaperone DnaJ [Patescibacteria group bacterium]MBU2632975.1 molecular chaperone DnaJ [Patescibacteria group bacterium]